MPYYDTVTNVLEKMKYIPSTAWTALSYGDTNAKSRKYIGVFNRSENKLYVTTDSSASVTEARAIRAGGERIFPYSDKVTLYGRCGVSGNSSKVVITEECG